MYIVQTNLFLFVLLQTAELHIYTDFLRIVLEILNAILTYTLPRNPEVFLFSFSLICKVVLTISVHVDTSNTS